MTQKATALSRKSGALRIALVLLAVVGVVYAQYRLDPFGFAAKRELREALEQRGRVAVLGELDEMPTQRGTDFAAAASITGLSAALGGSDGHAVARALSEAGVQALFVDPSMPAAASAKSVAARIARYEHVEGLRGLFVSRRAALYAPDPFGALSDLDRKALGGVARGLMQGARMPRMSSFPEALRRVQPVEVMVLLLDRGKPRLWRSARGSSLARALLTAATVARQRWIERQQAMGGPLEAALKHMSIDVALLGDDGTLGDRDSAFLDRAFTREHGVGYEDKGSWRYLLPEATGERGKGHASAAYRALFEEDGLDIAVSFAREELRLYRLFVSTLATSEPPPARGDGVSTVGSPDELLVAPKPQ